MTAPDNLFFVNKTPTQLCEQMRDFFVHATGEHSFMAHMTHDDPPLILKRHSPAPRRSRTERWRSQTPGPTKK